MIERSDRSRRVGEQIKRNLAIIINREVSDPRLGLVGVSDVRLSKDYKTAVVYINIFNDSEVEDSMAALNSAASFIRRELSQSLNQRGTPSLTFEHDVSIRDGVALSKLIDSVQ
ncbi:MAG: ribosome-binding factor A [Saprospiraceae bacterium]|jgi:ribosome-binding factor A